MPVVSQLEEFGTSRLIAQRPNFSDYGDVRRLHLHPQVMKTLSADGQILPSSVTLDGLRQDDAHWKQYGFGLWIFRDRTTGQFVGRGGLKWYMINERPVVGLSYAVIFNQWGSGLGTEMAAASLEQGFKKIGLSEVASWTLPLNRASQRVMEKVGFRYQADIVFAGLPHRLYRLTAIEWEMDRGSRT
jgi:RimJ/RimL family protein N-acetyltransferase